MTAGEFPILPSAFETSVALQLRFVSQRRLPATKNIKGQCNYALAF